MSEQLDESLLAMHTDCHQRLYVPSYFSNIALFKESKGDLMTEIATALATVTKVGQKIGTAVITMSPVATLQFNNVPGSPMDINITWRVLEDPLYNDSRQGTGKKALRTARQLVYLFHLFQPVGISNALIGMEPTIVPVQDPLAPVAYEVRFRASEAGKVQYNKVKMPQIVVTGTGFPYTVNFTCATAGAAFYYSTDLSYPRLARDPADALDTPTAILWDGNPLTISAPTVLRLAATFGDYIPSDVARRDFES